MNKPALPTDTLLEYIRHRFYPHDPADKRFHRDRRMLLYTLTWPAAWLEERALRLSPRRYETLLRERLDAIARHGDPAVHQRYFPRYLLKTLQDWFAWHGEDLYDELKHIRNQLHDLHHLLNTLHTDQTEDIVTPLAAAHAVLAHQKRRKSQPAPEQLNLF